MTIPAQCRAAVIFGDCEIKSGEREEQFCAASDVQLYLQYLLLN